MTIKCRKCNRGAQEIGGYLTRINEKGIEGIWECRPSCDSNNSFQENLLLALDNNEEDKRNENISKLS